MYKKLLLIILITFITTACSTQAVDETTTQVMKIGNVELEAKSIFSNQVEILLPKDFTIMSEEDAKIKYPNGNSPTLIYTNEDWSVNVAFNLNDGPVKDSDIPTIHKEIKQMYKTLFPDAEWLRSEVIKMNNQYVGVIEIMSSSIDGPIYNLMFFMEMDGDFFMATINSTEDKMDEWKPIAENIMKSVKVK